MPKDPQLPGGAEQLPASAKQSRESKPLKRLREALRLEGDAWDAFRKHALAGFTDYERATAPRYETRLRWAEVPAEWYDDPYVFGHVALRVLTRGRTELHGPVARHLFHLLDEDGIERHSLPPGVGIAWLRLAQLGQTEELEMAAVAELAYVDPESFFAGVPADELPAIARMSLTAGGEPRAWDIHCLFGAVGSARFQGRQVFHLFEALMAADWLTTEVKRQVCRGLLGCEREVLRLEEDAKKVLAEFSIGTNTEYPFPRVRLDVAQFPIGARMPGLRRCAVRSLATVCGEPVEQVLDEFFGSTGGVLDIETSSDMVGEGLLDLVDIYAERLGREDVRKWLRRALKQGRGQVRQAAYRIGLARFGEGFIRPALNDGARTVRQWAEKALAASNKKPFRSRAAQKGVSSVDSGPSLAEAIKEGDGITEVGTDVNI
ncbi:MAG TPA: hypothetical protein VND64_19425 [Pirellulales bacterium]|nr:hypothetical protein [Pirellulales bacterium]